MDGVHDMGGVKARFGPIIREEKEPVFHERWEGRVYGMRQATGPIFRLGANRRAIESLPSDFYLSSSYYEKWLEAFVACLTDKGIISEAELAARVAKFEAAPDEPAAEARNPELAKTTLDRIFSKRIVRIDVPNESPAFKPGDTAVVRDLHPPGHIRLPGYLKGKAGVIERYNGYYDIHDHERSIDPMPPPEPLYAVSFDTKELWGEKAEPGRIIADLTESYLEPPAPRRT